jgi:hypothetical protein
LPNGKDVMTAARKATEPYVDFAGMQLGDANFRRERRRSTIGASGRHSATPTTISIGHRMWFFGNSRGARNATYCRREMSQHANMPL